MENIPLMRLRNALVKIWMSSWNNFIFGIKKRRKFMYFRKIHEDTNLVLLLVNALILIHIYDEVTSNQML